MKETCTPSLGWEDSLEKEMATHSSILAWRIPWTEEPCGLQSMGLQESDMIWWLNNLTTIQRKGLQKAGGYLWQPKPHTGTVSHLRSPAFCFYLEVLSSKPIFFFPTVWRSDLNSDSLSWSFLVSNLFSIQLAFWKHIHRIPPPLGPLGGTDHPFPLSISLYNFWLLENTQLSSGLSVSSPVPPCSLCFLQLRFHPFRPYHLGGCRKGRRCFVILSPPPFMPS